jgi:signal transduction histidine kinase
MRLSNELPEIYYRTIAIYLEIVVGAVLFFMFLYFAKIYQRKFLRAWGYSWLALIIFMSSTLLITTGGYFSNGLPRVIMSSVSIAACLTQMALILLGTYIHRREQNFRTRHFIFFLTGILAFSLLAVLFKNEVEGAAAQRYLVRVGVKYLLAGVGFLWAGLVISTNPQFTRGLGQKMFSYSLIGLGLADMYYAGIVAINYLGGDLGIPIFYGLLELILNAIMAIGMVTWLLEDERGKLKKANSQLDSFLYSTSHDLRAPIASILGLTNLAKIELKEETALKYFDMVENRVKKMDLVIADILQFARTTKAELKLEQIDFNKLLQEVISDLRFNEGATAIHLRYTPNPSFQLLSDYIQLKIILGNLVGNAVKYHHVEQADPFIAVRLITKKEEIIIEVEDNGTGIAKQYQEKIFTMFFRASTKSEGTGLGLYIVGEAVAKLRGRITVTSEVGKGSVFTVTLPKA